MKFPVMSDAARRNSEQAAREHDEAIEHRQRQCDDAERFGLWLNSNVPQLHRDIPQFTPEQLAACERIAESFGSGAIWALLGEWGTGKTQMAVWLIKTACNSMMRASFTTAIEFFVRLRSPYRDDSTHRDEQAVINYYTAFDLLAIDDAHVRADSDYENRLLHHVIDKRHGAMRETILTSNQSEAVFCDTIGGAVVDRMCAAGGIIECNWPSFRGKDKTNGK